MIQLHTAERLDDLAIALAARLRDPVADPMTPEVLIVPTSGMQRWLSLELSRRLGTSGPGRVDGVSANFEMRFPGSLGRLLTAGDDDFDPWDLERVAWVLLEVLADAGDVAPPLAPGATAWARARRLADLFDRYMTHRPAMIRAWANDTDLDGAGRPLDAHTRWQAQLWRLLRQRIGMPSPPELLTQRISDVRAGHCPDTVPQRITLFGLATIPGGAPMIEQLDALGTQREVLLFMHQPSLAVAASVAAAAPTATPQATAAHSPEPAASNPRIRVEDRSSALVTNTLLASWGRPAREALVLLGDRFTGATSIPAERGGTATTLLEQLQDDLRGDTSPDGSFELSDDDHSITIHSCYGETRQVEVLRDQILHLLVDDPTLDEDDIVVLCPSLGTFAPLIESVLGPPGGPVGDPGSAGNPENPDAPPRTAPWLRYRLSDRSLGSAYPLLGALGALLELLSSRFSDQAVLEFVSLDPVSRRHGFDDATLATIAEWVDTANTRWGIDGHHREQWGIPAGHETGSWRRGVDRLLMGIAIDDRDFTLAPGDLAPIGVEGSDVSVAGRLASLLDRLAHLATQTSEKMPAHRWIEVLRQAVEDLFSPDPDNPWEAQRLNDLLARIDDAAVVVDTGADPNRGIGRTPSAVDLSLADIRHLIGAELGNSTGRSDFFRGGITFCTPTPMRSVPHRVVCLLGMDDSAFSPGTIDGDDLIAAEPHVGDSDRRAEGRHVLLDAVLAARDHLVVLRNGHDIVTNQEIPAAVPIAELADVLRATLRPSGRDLVAQRLTVEHPRQRFDEANFHTEAAPARKPVPPSVQLGIDRPWSFDPSDCTGASAGRYGHRSEPFVGKLLAPVEPETVTLDDLRDFLSHPPRYFLKQVLELSLPRPPGREGTSRGRQPTGSSGLPMAAPGKDLLVDLGDLESWDLRQRLLEHLRAGGDTASLRLLLAASDLLPPQPLGDLVLGQALERVEPVVAAVRNCCELGTTPERIHIDIELRNGVRILGTVRDDGGERPGPITADMSSLKPKHLLSAWLDALVLGAADPARPWQAMHIAGGTKQDTEPRITAFAPADAELGAQDHLGPIDALEVVVDLFLRGHREPLPLFPALSFALAHRPGDASQAWGSKRTRGDGNDEWIRIAFDEPDLRSITSLAVRDGDPRGPGDDRATRYAKHLWSTVKRSSPGPELKL